MDPREFDALIARLANGPTRRDALKGVAGGTLAAIGISAVDEDSEAKKKKKKSKKNSGGKNKAEAEKKKKKRKRKVCHNGKTIKVSKRARKKHLRHGDTRGKCPPYGA